MIIDSHFHLTPNEIPTADLIAAMDRHGITKTALIAQLCSPIDEPGNGLLALMRFAMQRSLTRFMVKPFVSRFTDEGDVKLPSGPVSIYPDPDNESVFEAVDAHPNRFFGWVFVNPHGMRPPLEELSRWESHPGYIGVKAHPFWHQYSPMALSSIAARLEETGAPLLIHLGFGEHGAIVPLLDAFPKINVIIAHAGTPYYRTLWKEIREYPGAYVDLSASAFVNSDVMRAAVDALGARRCLFGTDGPFGPTDENGMFDYGHMLGLIRETFPDEETQKQLLETTFKEVAGLI